MVNQAGTAGGPMLNILSKNNLCNVLVIVTRYFGGILLGTGGLVRAYSSAAKEAILASKKVEMKLCSEYQISVDYNYYDILNHYFNKNKIVIKNVNYNEKIELYVILEKVSEEKILKEIEEITDRKIATKIVDTYYYA